MGKSFRTYKQLTAEKEKLEQLLKTQKQLIRADVEELKLSVKPFSEIRAHMMNFTKRNAASLSLALTSDIIAKKIFKGIVMERTGWLGKILVPYFLKNYSSSFVAEEKKKLITWFKSWFKREFHKPIKQVDSSAGI